MVVGSGVRRVGIFGGNVGSGFGGQHVVVYALGIPESDPESATIHPRHVGRIGLMKLTCHACGSSDGRLFEARERMFGLNDPIQYSQCGQCGSLQNAAPPVDWKRYYPSTYYSFQDDGLPASGPKAWLAGERDQFVATRIGNVGRWLQRWFPPTPDVASMGRVVARLDMNILDVGCGNGLLLRRLFRAGFRRLGGIDPNLTSDREIHPGVWLRQRSVDSITEKFDLVMLHHVLEHVPNPRQALSDCRRLLRPGGKVLVRMPVAGCAAWERYGTSWVSLDAPRHLCLPSRAGFLALVRAAELEVLLQWDDSTEFQFWASELYQRNISLFDGAGRMRNPARYFTPVELRRFVREAAALNQSQQGDQFAAILGPA